MNAPQILPDLDSPAAQAAFVRAMHDPAAYAALHPVQGPVRCVETHVSWVFLTGEFAYKVKKPLRLSFLDYSTPARREECCRAELRLNRRHAPGLYVEVVAITGTPAAPRLEHVRGHSDSPTAFEHALRMVQFDPSMELGCLVQADAVTPRECADLGTRIAQMHEQAARAGFDTPYGIPAKVHRVTLDNFAELASVNDRDDATAALPSAQLDALRASVQHLFNGGQARMTARRERGCVREAHGDLHCGNVVRWQGSLVAFDGIEFDPALRWIDVANDIAFLTMDLSAHGRDDLRREVLQAWLTATGDFDAVALLGYFECYRALVRAKVAALRGRQARDNTAAAIAQARRYLDWATMRCARSGPILVVMAGLSGSGKTWLARRIAVRAGALTVRSDIERKRLAGLQPLQASHSAPDAGLYSLDFNARTYAHLRACVASCLEGGESVVVDAANLRRGEREQFLLIARRYHARAVIVHCVAPLDVLRDRVRARAAGAADASEATVDLLDRQPSYWEPFGEDEQECVVTVDTTDAAAADRTLDVIASLRSPTGVG